MRRTFPWSKRNPIAGPREAARALAVAHGVARERSKRDRASVVLVGSWIRGTARRYSDIDLVVVGHGSGRVSRYRGGFFVNIKETTFAAEAREMRDPRRAGQAVPGWREAVSLMDPRGTVSRLKARAERFDWGRIGPAADRCVANEIVGWAEEAVKLTRLMADDRRETAAVQRNLLVDAMASAVAVRNRIFYNENELWETVGTIMGERWHRAQRASLGLDGVTFEGSCEAALELYRLTAAACIGTLSSAERSVVTRACRAVGHPLE